MAPQLESKVHLLDPSVQKVFRAQNISDRRQDILHSVEERLAPMVGLSTKYKLAFDLNPSGEKSWVVKSNEGAEFVTGFIKQRSAGAGEGRILPFSIDLSRVGTDGTITEMKIGKVTLKDPAKNAEVVKGLVTLAEHGHEAAHESPFTKVQKPISFVGTLKDGALVLLAEKNPAFYGNESEKRAVDVSYYKNGQYGHYRAEVENFPKVTTPGVSAERNVKLFDHSGTHVGDLNLKFSIVPLARDRTILEAFAGRKDGHGAAVDRDLSRKAADGKLFDVTFTPANGKAEPVMQLR